MVGWWPLCRSDPYTTFLVGISNECFHKQQITMVSPPFVRALTIFLETNPDQTRIAVFGFEGNTIMNNKSNEHQQSLSELITQICDRPRMFTPHGTFDEVYCWLSGFFIGLKECDSPLYAEWQTFDRWIHRRLKFPPSYGWCDRLKGELDDAAALQLLLSLFTEFSQK